MKEVGDKVDFNVRWAPFMLDPEATVEGVDKREMYKERNQGVSSSPSSLAVRQSWPSAGVFPVSGWRVCFRGLRHVTVPSRTHPLGVRT